ncbi:type II toxin-antitoxin system VapC family toxin [Candidatus Palauibacter sp.]|uniref:type II toxin-antitoxin system VapC family toxin n=1 Tax=Candidatus Palauibacter sp. TaxID=3101350 RepID=UPI003AF1E803
MTVVVDASVLAAAVAHLGPNGAWCEAALAESAREGRSLAGPQLVLAEASNVLHRLALAERLESSEASLAGYDLLALEIELFPFEPLADRTWELRHNLSIYDGWYVALAETLSCPLLTLDQRLARAAGPTCRIITPPPLRPCASALPRADHRSIPYQDDWSRYHEGPHGADD